MWPVGVKSAADPSMEQSHSTLPGELDAVRTIITAQADQLTGRARKLQSRDPLIDKLKARLPFSSGRGRQLRDLSACRGKGTRSL